MDILAVEMEAAGYLASLTVTASLLMSNMRWLRVSNTCGCVLFVGYGLVISAFPVVLLNSSCTVINVCHLIKMKKKPRNNTRLFID